MFPWSTGILFYKPLPLYFRRWRRVHFVRDIILNHGTWSHKRNHIIPATLFSFTIHTNTIPLFHTFLVLKKTWNGKQKPFKHLKTTRSIMAWDNDFYPDHWYHQALAPRPIRGNHPLDFPIWRFRHRWLLFFVASTHVGNQCCLDGPAHVSFPFPWF